MLLDRSNKDFVRHKFAFWLKVSIARAAFLAVERKTISAIANHEFGPSNLNEDVALDHFTYLRPLSLHRHSITVLKAISSKNLTRMEIASDVKYSGLGLHEKQQRNSNISVQPFCPLCYFLFRKYHERSMRHWQVAFKLPFKGHFSTEISCHPAPQLRFHKYF